MESQLINVFTKVFVVVGNLLSTAWGKLLVAISFTASLLMPIKDILLITFGLVMADMFFGLLVTIKIKGWSHILSSRLRDSLVKLFFYTIFIVSFYLIESRIIDGYYVTSKAIFAILSGVELWSISANMLILSPNILFLRIFRKYLIQEMAKKLDMAREDVEEFLKEKSKLKKNDKVDTKE